jgi:8-oxo-dGTP diphosphatase
MIFFQPMFIESLGAIWRRLPGFVRRRLVRIGQRRFTASVAALIFDDQGQILLLEHVFRPDSGWGIPGGFLNQGEQPEAALRRELREEIGIEVENVELLFARTLRRPKQIEFYFRATALGTPEPCSFEIKSAAWFSLDDLPSDLSKDQRRLISRALTPSENSYQ